MSTARELGEHALIARILQRLRPRPFVVVGAGDDAAVVAPEPRTLDALTMDALVEGVHFDRRFVDAASVGHRLLAVSLSDLAAMGARPRVALLSLALPDSLEASWLDGMLDGLLALADAHGIALVGGNITRSPGPLLLDLAATGSVRPRRVLVRSGARPGDGVYVTGALGGARVGLHALQHRHGVASPAPGDAALAQAAYPVCEQRYLRPTPRVRAGQLLGRSRAATACMDLSDGLADAARAIAAASGVGVTLDAAAVPVEPEALPWLTGCGLDPVEAALAGGDDYELLFTSGARQRGRLRSALRTFGDLPVTRIGTITTDPSVCLRRGDSLVPLVGGFEHFR
ncbi:MAG: thiamine-phosphate kinase [Vicinamibacterales bacterium]